MTHPLVRSTLHVKQAPRRTCVGCRTTRAKPELVRIAATPEGVAVDPTQSLPGRGAYVCPDPQCIDTIDRANGQPLRRALRTADHRTIPVAMSELRMTVRDLHGSPEAGQTAPAGPASRRSTTTRSSNA